MHTCLTTLAAAAVLISSLTQGAAQEWPVRPVTMVVPFTSGTTSDVVARALMDHLSKAIGQPIVIDNRGGAGGNIGAGMVAKAKPDGYTILLATTGPAATNKLMYKTMSFDPQRDFADIVLVGKAPVIIVARPNGPANSLQGLIGYAKANPDKVTAGFPGNGTLGHITGKLLQERSGIKFGETQYRGSTPIITDLLGGHIDIAMDLMAAYVPQVQDGKLRALAIASSRRFAGLPDVPDRLGGRAARLRSKRLVRDASADRHAGTSHRKIECGNQRFSQDGSGEGTVRKARHRRGRRDPERPEDFRLVRDRKVGANHQERKYRVLNPLARTKTA